MEQYEIEREVARELSSSERLLWSGQPRQGLMFRPADALMIPFSILWCGFAIFWEFGASRSDQQSWFFTLWGIPFVLVGLYMVFGRFFADARERQNTLYAITNERVMIIGGLFKRVVRSFSLRTLPEISLTEQDDGRGTITLGPGSSWYASAGWSSTRQQASPALEGIQNVRAVYETLRQAQKTA